MTKIIFLFSFLFVSQLLISQSSNDVDTFFVSNINMQKLESVNWSNDGEKLVFAARLNGQWDLFIYNLIEKTLINISNTEIDERKPVWFPDGKNIVYNKHLKGNSKLYLKNIDSANENQLFNRNIKCVQASFSNSSNLVCFLGFNDLNSTWQIFTYDFIYDNLNQITDHKTSCNAPVFSPDGKHILYELISADKNTTLKMVNWYGNPELHFDTITAFAPYWDNKSWRFSFIGKTKTSKIEVFSVRKNGESLNKITENNIHEKEYVVSPNGKYVAIIFEEKDSEKLMISKLFNN